MLLLTTGEKKRRGGGGLVIRDYWPSMTQKTRLGKGMNSPCASDACLPEGSQQTPSTASGVRHWEAQDLAPSYCGRNRGMGRVPDWAQEWVQERVLALAKAPGGASRQGLWAWTSTPVSASRYSDTELERRKEKGMF